MRCHQVSSAWRENNSTLKRLWLWRPKIWLQIHFIARLLSSSYTEWTVNTDRMLHWDYYGSSERGTETIIVLFPCLTTQQKHISRLMQQLSSLKWHFLKTTFLYMNSVLNQIKVFNISPVKFIWFKYMISSHDQKINYYKSTYRLTYVLTLKMKI